MYSRRSGFLDHTESLALALIRCKAFWSQQQQIARQLWTHGRGIKTTFTIGPCQRWRDA